MARAYLKALSQARRLIYLEDQYLWSAQVAAVFAAALARQSGLHLIAVVPSHPDQDGLSGAAQHLGRAQALRVLRAAAGDRVAVYGLENPAGVPVYVHAKVCFVDDEWAAVGSDNVNLRSWTYDSELSCAVYHPGFAGDLRRRLAAEHLDDPGVDVDDPLACFAAFARGASRLEEWYRTGRHGPRPPGHLRPHREPPSLGWRRPPAAVMYRWLCDPDGRPRALRRAGRF